MREDAVSLGETIASARAAAGLTVEQVSERTRIRGTVVRAIENDEFSLCGGDVYVRGHLRAIAQTVGLDADPLIAQYDAEHTTSLPTAAEVFEAETSTQRRRRGPNWSAVMAAALVAAVGLVAVQVFRADSNGSRETTTVADPAAPISEATTSSAPAPTESETPIAQAPRDEVDLKISALPDNLSWVQVSDRSDVVLFSGTLAQGQSKSFSDPKQLKVIVGNAAGVNLMVNGVDVGSPGASGEVARLTFTPNDPQGSAG
jgi:cytoskeleton protein RodZ